jgi:release factor glutamine methyltransferase
VLVRATDYLARHGVDSPRRTAEILLEDVLDTDRAGLYSLGDDLSAHDARAFGRALCRRCSGEPLQHITGAQSFMGLDLQIRPGVFVPRPETEVVAQSAVEMLTRVADPLVAVDLCTGTGAIALWVKHRRPEARVLAVDISAEAVRLAGDNASRLGIEIEILRGDLFDPLPRELEGSVDLIVSNPPYLTEDEYATVDPEVRADPLFALVGGTAAHRAIVQGAATWLRPGGALVVEIGAGQADEVVAIFRERLEEVRVMRDLAGRDRVVGGRLP